MPFRDLIQPAYLGLMAEDDVQEQSVQRVTQDVEMTLAGGCRLKLHCGPGMVKRGNVEDKEVRFILDNDVFMNGKIELKHSAERSTPSIPMRTAFSAARSRISSTTPWSRSRCNTVF